MTNYLKKILSKFSYHRVKKDKAPLTVLYIWRVELIIAGILFVVVIFADIWIYRNLGSRRVDIPNDNVSRVDVLSKRDIVAGGSRIREHENLLNNPTFPLTENPF